jgi:mono/diheme cytochrome c family protein
MKSAAGVFLFGVVALVGWYVVGTSGSGADIPAYRNADVVAEGAAIYERECAACHGADLEGQPEWRTRDADGYLPAPPHDETGHTWHHPTAQLFEITKYGTEAIVGGGYRSNMMGFGDVLTDEQILATLAYIKSTWPSRIVERHDEMDAAYEAARP